ncbi:hypothetical protein DRW07_17460 [Alteromonas sediminis]|uniref:Peptidase A2 n=1 Tax=Alteromonas sediminis TaxID=2259342 RepID=A0A3N5XX72_9ALTE|nr:retropepsin-like aspartic protease [Alteromonas sediminis]RPJ65100.1 hypothetical protein DRW07_17460 [Alteromonas sediminis]
MNKLTIWLIVILLASVGFNLFLWYGKSKTTTPLEMIESKPASQQEEDEYRPFSEVRAELDIEPLRRLLKNGEYVELGRRLNDALRALPNNTELLLMEAEYFAKTKPLPDAILNYYTLLDRPIDRSTQTLIQGRIDNLVKHAITPLKQEQQWDLLAQFLEPLFQRKPGHKFYTLQLAEAYGRQENYTLMENTLAEIDENDPEAKRIRDIAYNQSSDNGVAHAQYKYTGTSSGKSNQRIPLIRSGDQFLVDLVVEQTPVRMLVDTGASISALSARTYERLSETYDSQFLGVFDVKTAAGNIRAPMVTFSKVSLGDYEFRDLTIIIIPTDPFDQAEGLLGMNLLKAFDFRIDQRAAMLVVQEL